MDTTRISKALDKLKTQTTNEPAQYILDSDDYKTFNNCLAGLIEFAKNLSQNNRKHNDFLIYIQNFKAY